jgi:type III secretion protein C
MMAAAPQLSRAAVSITAERQPIGTFITDLFRRGNLEVHLSAGVHGFVSGRFEGPLPDVYAKVARAFNLVSYFDGAKVYVYSASEITTRRFVENAAQAEAIRRLVERRGLPDRDNQVSVSGNRLVARGVPRFTEQVAEAAREAMNSSPPVVTPAAGHTERPATTVLRSEYRVFRLRYAWAADTRMTSGGRTVTVPGVATVLRSLIEDGPSLQLNSQVEILPSSHAGLAGTGLAAKSGGEGRSLGSGLADLFSQVKAPRQDPPPAPPASRADSDRPRVQADPRMNAVIIRDTPDRLASYAALIDALDSQPEIIAIEATIIDIDRERLSAAGLRLEYREQNGTGFQIGPENLGDSSGQGFTVSAVIGNRDRFLAELRVLQSKGVARIVSRPLVVTLSDVEATFENSQTFFVPVSGSLSTDLYDVVAGTRLRVTPHASRELSGGRIRLLVDLQDGSVGEQRVGQIPVVSNAGLNTEAIVLDGQSLLVGGMVTQSGSTSHSRVPGLSNIPLAGALFRQRQEQSRHVERLFLITPRLTAPGQEVGAPTGADPVARSLSPMGDTP